MSIFSALGFQFDLQILAIIAEHYDNYEQAKQATQGIRDNNPLLEVPEPALTIAYLRDYLRQTATPAAFRNATLRQQTAFVRSSLARLQRRGDVQYSTGTGLRGRQARCFEIRTLGRQALREQGVYREMIREIAAGRSG